MKRNQNNKLLNKISNVIRMSVLTGSMVAYSTLAYAIVPNTELPSGANFVSGGVNEKITTSGNVMNVVQNNANAVLTWNKFNVGANATVNFAKEGGGNFNTLNYVNGGNMSEIYGTLNANGGNIFLVNHAGVQIAKSAQINVGSLYVSNQKLDESKFQNWNGTITNDMYAGGQSNAQLMSLGNIHANNVTFEGERIVIDVDRLKDAEGNDKTNKNLTIKTTSEKSDVVLGYEAYNHVVTDADAAQEKTYYTNGDARKKFTVQDGNGATKDVEGYMWVKNAEQLQEMESNLQGNYALYESIGAIVTEEWKDNADAAAPVVGFKPVGSAAENFSGKFDGLDYSIFGLTINRSDTDNVGLFGAASDAQIKNVSLVSGNITGRNNVGSVVGLAQNTSVINITNSIDVAGRSNVGGIVGNAQGSSLQNLVNVSSTEGHDNVGGLVGSMQASVDGEQSILNGASYNLGATKGRTNGSFSHEIGGLVGSAKNSTIGNADGTVIYNELHVSGGYNVGGVVGSGSGLTLQNVTNYGDVSANAYTSEAYQYNSADTQLNNNLNNDHSIIDGKTTDGRAYVNVNVANVGGVIGLAEADSNLTNVTNDGGNVSSRLVSDANLGDYYESGNVGGIAGKVWDSNINNALNLENHVLGAHNVGGIAGMFGSESKETAYTIDEGTNRGSEIMATCARLNESSVVLNKSNAKNNGFAQESVRNTLAELLDIGNMGGVVGYMYGDKTSVKQGHNSGTVHSETIVDGKQNYKAANAGGVVGKIDRNITQDLAALTADNPATAAVSEAYNIGDVEGYRNVGGIVGMMYHGEITSSYNLGAINSTRQSLGTQETVNLGGILGDATEGSNAWVTLYDVYNQGQIGDDEFHYGGRHMGGIVGRLNGTLANAYNQGDIYNNYAVTGGLAGYFLGRDAKIENSFNTGNITVYHKEKGVNGTNIHSAVGGLAGGIDLGEGNVSINNAYNIGTLRSFNNGASNHNLVGGIGGIISKYATPPGYTAGSEVSISNVYSTNRVYAYKTDGNPDVARTIFGNVVGGKVSLNNVYSVQDTANAAFAPANNTKSDKTNDFTINVISAADMDAAAAYSFAKNADGSDAWRFYEGTTPILNAFTSSLKEAGADSLKAGITLTGGATQADVQFGTAYDPNAVILKQGGLDVKGYTLQTEDSLIAYNGDVNLTNVKIVDDRYYAGTVYSGGKLTLDGGENHIKLGGAGKLYGSDVEVKSNGDIEIRGAITATGNKLVGNEAQGNIVLSGGSVEVFGKLNSAQAGENAAYVDGIGTAYSDLLTDADAVSKRDVAMPTLGNAYAGSYNNTSTNGNISVTANTGDANLRYGVDEIGKITTAGDLEVTAANGSVYVDSDLSLGGKLVLNAQQGDLLDITNVSDKAALLDNFSKHTITFTGAAAQENAKLTVDMWDYNTGAYDFNKYTSEFNGSSLNEMQVVNTADASRTAQDHIYLWINNFEQLKGIEEYASKAADTVDANPQRILNYNFALKNNIDASATKDGEQYQAIAASNDASGYNGTFDGRGHNILDLKYTSTDVAQTNTGIFSTIGANGVVKNIDIYSTDSIGTKDVGTVAGTNKGLIKNITTFGNIVQVNETSAGAEDNTAAGTAGGIVGINRGVVDNVNVSGIAYSKSTVITDGIGGVAGHNHIGASITNSLSNSHITVINGNVESMGGIVGINEADAILENVSSKGIVSGLYNVTSEARKDHSSASNDTYTAANNAGGIVGVNNGIVRSVYNEAIVSGYTNVGGVIGMNVKAEAGDGDHALPAAYAGSVAENLANASTVYGGSNIGGVVGTSGDGSISDARNNGIVYGNVGIQWDKNSDNNFTADEITTGSNVGGIVGVNLAGSRLNDIANDKSASISGNSYVGGIAGDNYGEIDSSQNLVNEGQIYGVQYVGGVAGKNSGTIENINSNIALHINSDYADKNTYQYFGGVTGHNDVDGTITNATNEADVKAYGADFVGGITGKNDGTLSGFNGNHGNVIGADHVGGAVGENTVALLGTKTADGNSLLIENTGTVMATNGSAAGVIAVQSGNIANTTMTNSGKVLAHGMNGMGTGGVIGVISDHNYIIEDSTLWNDGLVAGGSNVGGVIGTNNAKIKHSDVYNKVNGTVVGTSNVGGIIGTNNDSVVGGRDMLGEGSNYYKYQVFNNGNVIGTSDAGVENIIKAVRTEDALWLANVVDSSVAITAAKLDVGNSSNVGGLLGWNAKATASELVVAYNTGSVSGADNVGGIAGNNGGKIDQVFNALAGTNSISSNGAWGNLAGKNQGGIFNAYNENTHTENNLHNVGTGYAVVAADYTNPAVWKQYSGQEVSVGNDKQAENMLAVFLTNAQVTLNDEAAKLTYDAHAHNIGVQVVTKADGMVDNSVLNLVYDGDGKQVVIGKLSVANTKAAHGLQDYLATLGVSGSDAMLIIGANGIKESGEYQEILHSHQINKNIADNPNNLGFNFVTKLNVDGKGAIPNQPVLNIQKAQLTLQGNDTVIKLGEVPCYSGTDVNAALQSGDKVVAFSWGVDNLDKEHQLGVHPDSVIVTIDGVSYDLGAAFNAPGFWKNYEVSYKPGTLTVNPPDLPAYYNWSNLFEDAPFDRNETFRERKAEVEIVDGGMEL